MPRRVTNWPLVRQVTTGDRTGRGEAVRSAATASLRPRTATADRVVKSICPYCAVGCGQEVHVREGAVIQIEGDPGSPISRGRLCPKARPRSSSPPGRPASTGCGTAHPTPPTGRTSASTRRWT